MTLPIHARTLHQPSFLLSTNGKHDPMTGRTPYGCLCHPPVPPSGTTIAVFSSVNKWETRPDAGDGDGGNSSGRAHTPDQNAPVFISGDLLGFDQLHLQGPQAPRHSAQSGV